MAARSTMEKDGRGNKDIMNLLKTNIKDERHNRKSNTGQKLTSNVKRFKFKLQLQDKS